MTIDDRTAPSPNPRDEKKDEKVADLPAREASGKDEQVKGGRMKAKPN